MQHEGQGAAIHLEQLTKRFAGVEEPAVDAINLDIAPGEFMTLLGPSGSGKTTTLNMIAGFTHVTSGRILVNGNDIVSLPTHKRNMGMVFQQYALFPHMTAAQNVAFPLQQRRVRKGEIERRVKDALDLVHLGDYEDRYPRQMSGGQQQRVAVARALVFDPQVLLMDEPLGALDKRLREQLQVELARIHRSLGLTFIFVTHDQEEALSLSDRIAVFNRGHIEQVGTAAQLYERPETLFVSGFLGDSTVIPGVMEKDGLATELGLLKVNADHPIAMGDPAAIVVRPERLHVLSSEPAAGTNVLDATVTDVVYLGSSRKLVLQTALNMAAVVRETAGETSAVGPGDRVLLTWLAKDAVVVPASARELADSSNLAIPEIDAETPIH